jgi:predicted small lipoprotein YifL
MKKIFLSFLLISVLTSISTFGQDCKMYFPDKVGSIREQTNYDKKGKITGIVKQEIMARDVVGAATSVTVNSKTYDKDSKELSVNQMVINCKNGVFSFDMKDYIDKSMLEAYKDMEIVMTGDNLAFPSGLKIGDKLDNASINIVVKNQGMVLMNWTITISNRVVAAQESITTEAGTFSCFKITYDLLTKTRIMSINTKAAEWMSEGAGSVKTEAYDKTGKLMNYSLLTKLK